MLYYNVELSEKAKRDIRKISNYIIGEKLEKIYKKINKDIQNLQYMPRMHKTILSTKDMCGEYRRMISGKYIIIYQIEKEKINILRVFSGKQNYLNSKHFILKEEFQKYIVI